MDTNIKREVSKQPKVTVLMPVYNGEAHLSEAIGSILKQSFRDFEFLIINDGSTDRSVEIIKSYHDLRIVLIQNAKNLGVVATLNKGLEIARGEYVARMDCDDISLPARLEKQTAFLDRNPYVGVCGTWFRPIGDSTPYSSRPSADPEMIRCGFLFNSMIGHPTAMIRRELFKKHHLFYNPAFPHAEDFELWIRALKYCDIANISEFLLYYRSHVGQVTRRFSYEQAPITLKIRSQQLTNLGIRHDNEELEFHQSLCTGVFIASPDFFKRADAWLCRIKTANDLKQFYPEPAFSKILVERWFTICFKAAEQGVRMPKLFLTAQVLKKTGLGWPYLVKFLMKAVFYISKDKLSFKPSLY